MGVGAPPVSGDGALEIEGEVLDMTNPVTIVSADGHAAAPLADYRPYIEQRWLDAFDDQVGRQAAVAIDFFEIFDPPVVEPWKEAFYDSGVIAGRADPELRLKALETEGIVAEVLFPDGAPFGAGGLGSEFERCPLDQETAGARAYNRWLADFIDGHEQRFAAQAILVLAGDVDDAVADVRWAAEHGFRGLVMPGISDDRPQLFDPRYSPVWSAVEEAGLLLNFHGGIGLPSYGPPIEGVPLDVRVRLAGTEFPFFAHRPLWHLIWSGVLERHPRLRLVFTEQHSDWVPAILAKLDHSWEFGKYSKKHMMDVVPRKPSDYWARQCFTGSSVLSQNDLLARDGIGVDKMMFGADFPHPEGTCMRTLDYLRSIVPPDMTEGELRRFLGGNAVEVYGLNGQELDELAVHHGPDLHEVMTPLPIEEATRKFARTDVFRPPT